MTDEFATSDLAGGYWPGDPRRMHRQYDDIAEVLIWVVQRLVNPQVPLDERAKLARRLRPVLAELPPKCRDVKPGVKS